MYFLAFMRFTIFLNHSGLRMMNSIPTETIRMLAVARPKKPSTRIISDIGTVKIISEATICVKLFTVECFPVAFSLRVYEVLLYTASWNYPKFVRPAANKA